MTAPKVNPQSRTTTILLAVREGYGAEDIAYTHKIPVVDVRAIIADLRRGGFLPGGRRDKCLPPRERRKPKPAASKPSRSATGGVARADDDLLLAAIHLRVKGRNAIEIGRIQGRKPQTIRQATVAVMQADLAESGEPRGAVLKHYWVRA